METVFSSSRSLSENESENSSINKVETFYNKAIWKTKLGEYKKSMDYFFKTVDELKQMSGEEQSLDIAKCWNIIGDNYLKMNQFDKAFKYLNKSLEIKKNISDDLELAETYQSLSNYYDAIDDVQRSYDFKYLVFNIRLKLLGENNSLTADSINNLAICLMKLKDSENAEKYFLRSFKIRQQLSANKPNKELADSFFNLGIVYGKIENLEKSLENFKKACEIRESIFEHKNHQDLVESFSSLRIVYERLGDEENAEKFAELASEMEKKLKEEKMLLEADLLYTLGLTYKNYDDSNKALELFSKSYQIRKKIFTKKHALIQNIVQNMNISNTLPECDYSEWNYIQVFKWIQVNKINPKIVEKYFLKRFDGQYLKELISLVKQNRNVIVSEIEEYSNEVSQYHIEHFFKVLEALSKKENKTKA